MPTVAEFFTLHLSNGVTRLERVPGQEVAHVSTPPIESTPMSVSIKAILKIIAGCSRCRVLLLASHCRRWPSYRCHTGVVFFSAKFPGLALISRRVWFLSVPCPVSSLLARAFPPRPRADMQNYR